MDNTVEILRLQATDVTVAQAGGPICPAVTPLLSDDQKLCIEFLGKLASGGGPSVSLTQGYPSMSARTPQRGYSGSKQLDQYSSSEPTTLGGLSVVPPHEDQESASNGPFAEQSPTSPPCDQAVVFSPPSRTQQSYPSGRVQHQCESTVRSPVVADYERLYSANDDHVTPLSWIPPPARDEEVRFPLVSNWTRPPRIERKPYGTSTTTLGQPCPVVPHEERPDFAEPYPLLTSSPLGNELGPPLFPSSTQPPRIARKNKRASNSFARTSPRRYESPPPGYCILPEYTVLPPPCDAPSVPGDVEVPVGAAERIPGSALVERRERDRYRAEKPYAGRETSRYKSIVARRGDVMKISSIVNPAEGWGSEGQRAIYVPWLSLGASDVRDGGQDGVGTSISTVPCIEMEVDGGDSVVVEEVPDWEEGMRSLPLALRRERRVGRKLADLSKRLDGKKGHTPLIQNSSTAVQCVEPPTAGHTSTPEDLSIDHESTPRPTLVQRTGKVGARKRRETKPYEKKEATGKARGPYSKMEQRKRALEDDPNILAYSRINVWCAATGAAIKLDDRDKCGPYYPFFWRKHAKTCHARKNKVRSFTSLEFRSMRSDHIAFLKAALDEDEDLVKEKTNPYSVHCAECDTEVFLHSKEERERLEGIKNEMDKRRKEAQENLTPEERASYSSGKEKAPSVKEEMNYKPRHQLCMDWYRAESWLEHKKACTGGRGESTK